MSNSKIVVDADTGVVDSKFKKTQDSAERVGKAIGGWGQSVVSTAAKLVTIVQVIRGISAEIEKSREKSIEASKSKGESSLTRENALISLGIKNPGVVNQGFRNTDSEASEDDITSFINSLNGYNKKAKKKLSQTDVIRAVQLKMAGGVDDDEIIKALEDDTLMSLREKGSRSVQSRGQFARDEAAQRIKERRSSVIAEDARFPGGMLNRDMDRHLGEYDATSVDGGVGRRIAYGVPLLGEGFRWVDKQVLKALGRISETNEKMAAPRPTMSPTTEAGP